MKIGEVALRSGLNTSAIRYYERMGLLSPAHRVGGQRRYPEDALHRILLICFARDMGFTLGEIKLFLTGLRMTRRLARVGKVWRNGKSPKSSEPSSDRAG